MADTRNTPNELSEAIVTECFRLASKPTFESRVTRQEGSKQRWLSTHFVTGSGRKLWTLARADAHVFPSTEDAVAWLKDEGLFETLESRGINWWVETYEASR